MKKVTILTMASFLMFGAVASQAAIDNIDIGGDFMLEYFFGENTVDLNDDVKDETDFLRTEFHLWFQADLDDNVMARISLEGDRALNQLQPGLNTLKAGTFGDLEIFIEEAFIKVMDIGGYGFSISAGRQFLNYGDDPLADNFNQWWGPGFIIADSMTNDPLLLAQLGSYEIDPFDAIVLSWENEQYRLDILHARDVEDNLAGPTGVTNDDATLWAIYGSYFGFENHQIDLYATFNDQNGGTGSIGFEGEKYIIGARAAGDITEEIAYKAEVAYQFEDNSLNSNMEADAFGAQAGINYHPGLEYNPNVGFIYTFLQQDGDYWRGFSSPFEGKTYGLLFEGLAKVVPTGGAGYVDFTNMHVFNVNGGFEPMQDVAWTLDFYYFLLEDDINLNISDDVGFEIDSQIDYRFNDNLTTFLGGGVYIPGDAVDDWLGTDDEAYFFRTGVKVAF
ncbi:MAG: alginate export family protein [Candidatus Omnitrophica bacterium]|nr:alginate export family protein [Candidatus Omnitrophota bacterium]